MRAVRIAREIMTAPAMTPFQLNEVFQFEDFRLDRQSRVLFRRDEAGAFVPMAVGSRALDVLDVLLDRAGNLVLRDELMAAVWPATAVEDTNLNMQIAAIRRVLDEGRSNGSCIQTIPGRGYRFTAPVTRVVAGAASSGMGADPVGHRLGPARLGVGGATPTRRAISLSPTPAVLKRSTSRTRRIGILSAGIRSPVQKTKGADPNRASRGLAYLSEIIPEWRAKSSRNAERHQIGT